MYCSHCGTHLANSSTFCYNCGQRVDAATCPTAPPCKMKPLVELDRNSRQAPNAKELVGRLRKKAERSTGNDATDDAEGALRPSDAKADSPEPATAHAQRSFNRKTVVVSVAAVVVVAACLVGVGWVSSTFFGPQAFVGEYFQAIADGASTKALSMTDSGANREGRAGIIGVIDGALDNPADRISDVSVGEVGADGAITVSYLIGGKPCSSEVTVKDLTPHMPFFKKYAISRSAEVAVPLANCGPNRMLLNGVAFELPSLPNSAYPVHLMCLPGRYTLTAPESDLYSCSQIQLVVASSAELVAPASADSAGEFFLEMNFSERMKAAAESIVATCIAECIERGGEAPENAPFKAHLTTNSDFQRWTGVGSMPNVLVLDGAKRKGASMEIIMGGSVLCATTSGGSVGYEYTYVLPPSKRYEKSGSARIQNMDIYVDLQNGAMSVVYDGNVIYGEPLDDDSTAGKSLEELISGLGLSDLLEDM